MKNLTIILLLILTSCSTKASKDSDENDSTRSAVKGTALYDAEFVKIDKNALDTLKYDRCFVSPIEVMDLYDSLSSIPHDKDEKIHLVQVLKKEGFVPETWAREKWLEGPRMISVTVHKGSCKCMIDKLYYSSDTRNKYRVTERLKCFDETRHP